jgi:ComF family protein
MVKQNWRGTASGKLNNDMKFLSPILNLLYPATCHICNQKTSDHFCPTCWDKIGFLKPPFCPKCGRPFASESSLLYSPDHLCSECKSTKTYFDKAMAIGPYDGTLAEAIHLFKYNGKKGLGLPLGRIMIDYIKSNPSLFPLELAERSPLTILPVPLHPKRLREREFNQSLLLAKEISKTLKIPLIKDNLQRIRWTRPQIELKGEERLKNVKGAFSLKDPKTIEGKSLLLIDDVYTTGATVRECSKVLKKAGAEKVYVFTLARVI